MNNKEIFGGLEAHVEQNRELEEVLAKRMFGQKSMISWRLPAMATIGLSLAVVVVLLGVNNPISKAPVVQAAELFAKASASLRDGFTDGKWLKTTYAITQKGEDDSQVTMWSDGQQAHATEFELNKPDSEATGLGLFSFDNDHISSLSMVDDDGKSVTIGGADEVVTSATSDEIKNVLTTIHALHLDSAECDAACVAQRINYDVTAEENMTLADGSAVDSYKLTSRVNSPYSHDVTTLWLRKDDGSLLKISESTPEGEEVYAQTTITSEFVEASTLPQWVTDAVTEAEHNQAENKDAGAVNALMFKASE